MTPPSDDAIAREHDLGGDPACWLNRVCETCGRFVDDEFARACPDCGAPRDPAGADRPPDR